MKLKQLQTGKLREARELNTKLETDKQVLQDMLGSANK